VYNTDLNTPKTELDQRIKKLKDCLQKKDIDAVLIMQRADLFYFTGTIQQSFLYIPDTGEPVLMVNRNTERARAESYIDNIVHIDKPKQIPDILASGGYRVPKTLGMELDVLPVNLYFSYQKLFNKTELKDISLDIRLLRAVKSSYEIDIMRRAAGFSDKVAKKFPGQHPRFGRFFDYLLNFQHGVMGFKQFVGQCPQRKNAGMIGKIPVVGKDVVDKDRFVPTDGFIAGALGHGGAGTDTAGGRREKAGNSGGRA